MNETTKKIVAREGLSAIGALLLAILICFVITNLCNGSQLYLFAEALKAFLILYGSYLVGRFIIWSLKTLKTAQEGKLFKVFKIVIYSLLILFALAYFAYYGDYKERHNVNVDRF